MLFSPSAFRVFRAVVLFMVVFYYMLPVLYAVDNKD